MRSATGNALLINIIITFVVIVVAVLISSISYTKAFKIKNKIVDTIEKYDTGWEGNEESIESELNDVLGDFGYRLNINGVNNCKERKGKDAINTISNYRYCIYEFKTTRGYYYDIIAYMYFDIPLIGDVVQIPVYGETKVFNKN